MFLVSALGENAVEDCEFCVLLKYDRLFAGFLFITAVMKIITL